MTSYLKQSIKYSLIPLSCLLLSACAEQPLVSNEPYIEGESMGVNKGYINGSVGLPNTKLPSLGDIRSMHKDSSEEDSPKKRAKLNQIRDDALAYGAQVGLYEGTKEIDRRLNQHAAELSNIYNFNQFLIRDKSGQLLLPPVITEQDDLYQSNDGGRSISVADKMYTIEKNVIFAPTSPLWHTYLFRSFQKPNLPSNDQLPANKEQQATWARYTTEGYDRGLHQSVDIFKQDMRQLQHDFGGMLRYYTLLENNQISAPYIAESKLGITGSDNKAVYNNRVLKIMDIPKLVVSHPEKIRSSISSQTPSDASTNPYDVMDEPGWHEKNPTSDAGTGN